jgi:hypothetical protein
VFVHNVIVDLADESQTVDVLFQLERGAQSDFTLAVAPKSLGVGPFSSFVQNRLGNRNLSLLTFFEGNLSILSLKNLIP